MPSSACFRILPSLKRIADATPYGFTVMSHNVLVPIFSRPPYCPPEHFLGREERLVDLFLSIQPAILSLQEVTIDAYESSFLPSLRAAGYDGILQKDKDTRKPSKFSRQMFTAIFWQRARFTFVNVSHRSRATIVWLADRLAHPSSNVAPQIAIASVHLEGDPQAIALRQGQLASVLRVVSGNCSAPRAGPRVHRVAPPGGPTPSPVEVPVGAVSAFIVTGDYNDAVEEGGVLAETLGACVTAIVPSAGYHVDVCDPVDPAISENDVVVEIPRPVLHRGEGGEPRFGLGLASVPFPGRELPTFCGVPDQVALNIRYAREEHDAIVASMAASLSAPPAPQPSGPATEDIAHPRDPPPEETADPESRPAPACVRDEEATTPHIRCDVSTGPINTARVDHIFYTACTLRAAACSRLASHRLKHNIIEASLPNETIPSDHLPLIASFEPVRAYYVASVAQCGMLDRFAPGPPEWEPPSHASAIAEAQCCHGDEEAEWESMKGMSISELHRVSPLSPDELQVVADAVRVRLLPGGRKASRSAERGSDVRAEWKNWEKVSRKVSNASASDAEIMSARYAKAAALRNLRVHLSAEQRRFVKIYESAVAKSLHEERSLLQEAGGGGLRDTAAGPALSPDLVSSGIGSGYGSSTCESSPLLQPSRGRERT